MRTRRAVTVTSLVWLVLAGCTGEASTPVGSSPSRAPTSSPSDLAASASGVRLAPLPRAVISTCRKVRQLQPACPTMAPEGQAPFDASTFASGSFWTFTAQVGIEGARTASPPRFVHLVAQAGDLGDAFGTFAYSRSSVVTPFDGILDSAQRKRLESLGAHGKTPRGLYLGRVTWGGRTGDLVLVPSFEFSDSIDAGHLLFTWSAGNVGYAISLHAWEPFLQTVSALRGIVTALPHP